MHLLRCPEVLLVSAPFSFVIGAQGLSFFHLGRQHIPEGWYRNILKVRQCASLSVTSLEIPRILWIKGITGA